MHPPPPGWPRISSALYYDGAKAGIDFLVKAFGFEVRLLVEGDQGQVEHSELTYGGGLVMVGEASAQRREKFPYMHSPGQVGGANTQNMMVFVDDVQAHHDRARAAGAKITRPLETHDYGEEYWTERGYECEDPGGHHWWFYQRLKTGPKWST